MKADEMRLIFKGKILKDDMTLDSYKITDGLTIHLVKGKTAGAAASTGATETQSNPTNPAAANPTAAPLNTGNAQQANPFAGMGMPGMGMGMGGMGMGQGMPGMGMGGQMPNP